MWIFNAIANAVGKNFIGTPNYLFGLLFNRVQADGGVTEAQQCTINELTELQNENLLSSASLVLTPSSYKEGTLYSVIPTNGNGDLTFTRATTATRVNSAGLVELVPYNLVLQSQTFENASWFKFGNASGLAPVVTSNAGTAPDGTLTADRLQFNCVGTTSSDRSILSQSNIPATIGSSYTMSFYVKAFAPSEVGKQLRIALEQGGIASVITLTADYQRIVFTGVASATTLNFLVETRGGFTTNTTADVLLWGAQVNEGTADLPYQKTETRLNIPRLDYSLGGCPSLLLEPQRTNLALRSQEFDNAIWPKANVSVTANTTISPDGTSNADSLIENTLNASHETAQGVTTTVISGLSYTCSFYVKANGRDRFRLILANQFAVNTEAFYNLSTGLPYSIGASATATMINVGNGWYRCTLTSTATLTGTAIIYLTLVSTGTTVTYLGNGTSGLYLWGAQLEQGAYATSYIPTTTASVTRNAEVLTRNNIYTNGLITASGGTWFVELKNNISLTRNTGADIVQSLGVSNGTDSGLVIRTAGTSRAQIYKYVAGSPILMRTTAADVVKVAIKWNGTSADVFENGVKVVSASSFTTTNMNFLQGSAVDFPKNISTMLLSPTPLTDTECIQLTTI